MSKKEVAVKAETQVAEKMSPISMEAFGIDSVLSSDIKIPLALLMQKMSVAVDQEKAKAGEIRGSLENNILGGVDKQFHFVPLYIQNVWVEKEVISKKYVQMYPRTRLNERQDLVYKNDAGVEIQRTKQIDVFVMSLDELKNGEAMPYKMSFKVMSFDAGRTLITIVTKLMMFGKPIYNYIFNVSSIKKENDKGSFFVFDLAQTKVDGKTQLTPSEFHQICSYWATQVASNKVAVDEEADTSFDVKSFEEEKF